MRFGLGPSAISLYKWRGGGVWLTLMPTFSFPSYVQPRQHGQKMPTWREAACCLHPAPLCPLWSGSRILHVKPHQKLASLSIGNMVLMKEYPKSPHGLRTRLAASNMKLQQSRELLRTYLCIAAGEVDPWRRRACGTVSNQDFSCCTPSVGDLELLGLRETRWPPR